MSKHQRKSHVHTTEITKSRTPAVTQLMSLLAEPSKLLGEVSDLTVSQGLGMRLGVSGLGRFQHSRTCPRGFEKMFAVSNNPMWGQGPKLCQTITSCPFSEL